MRKTIGQTLIKLAKFYGHEIGEEQLEMYIDVMTQFPPADVAEACRRYVRDTKNTRFPMPPHLVMQTLAPQQVDDRMVAIELARKIDGLTRSKGSYWSDGFYGSDGSYWEGARREIFSSFKEAVVSEVGNLGWHVICARGGWKATAASANEMEEGTFIAQLRDQVHAAISLAKAGVDVSLIDMPRKETLESRSGSSGGLLKASAVVENSMIPLNRR